jgi:hypothetical protein
VAVLLDATLVRGVLLPAAMKLLGEWNWYLPRWLERLPTLSFEAELREEGSGRAGRRTGRLTWEGRAGVAQLVEQAPCKR